ncbi:Fe-S cluster assembly protein SufD [Pradoshia sp. D12]|uniref:Fe-S cluster assembly protein SufD n=1 Tax=Bacillaceae TaxID=186817 RepID=UPI00080AD0FC|nr:MULTISPECIES: Fe-S cluster assembly protein SufD [Bacillaceae]OCA84825.1 Fe-S cluster assembly protein SufD [Bacillus sp. FJAT-27986]QFK72709.1 Fe-S cluster assembly protein SufD [Pradoshia sp. D12]TPF71703.1 Fe-S cluster assembly protein SufD [Bacillus sp. D12]
MTIETTLLEKDVVSSFSKAHSEPAWLESFRLDALSASAELPMPRPDKTKIDKWQLEDMKVNSVTSETFTSIDELAEDVKKLINPDENRSLYVQRNNTAAYLTVSQELKDKGVIFTDIRTAAKEHPELLQKYFMTTSVPVKTNKLTALHAALFNGGAFLYIPRNVVIEEPIQAIFMIDNAETELYNHVLVVAEESSSVTYVENYISLVDGKETIGNIISEVIVGNNAVVKYGAVDTLSKDMKTYVNRNAYVGNDGRVEWALGLMNDGNTISENITNLHGNGSYGDTKTVVVGTGKQTQNFTTKVVHFGKNSNGYILKHGVMKDEASSIFNGIGKIEHGATKADAVQESRVLMLSPKARGDANPILLIDEDDVTAGHAASVGRVDPIQLYYLMSRGISKTEAERLIIHGFLAPVVNQLPVEAVKKQLTEVIERKVK